MPRGIKKHWDRLWSQDPDDVFAYKTPRVAVIRDRRLGFMNLALTAAIIVYIVLVVIVDKGYLRRETPRGSGRMSVRAPATWPLPRNASYCVSGPAFPEGSGGAIIPSQRLPCRRLDHRDPAFVNALEGSIFVPTRVNETHLVPSCGGCDGCAEECGLYDEVPEDRRAYFSLGIEDFTVKIDIAAAAPALGLATDNTASPMRVNLCGGRGSILTARTIFTLRELLEFACIDDLDGPSEHVDGESRRYAGGVLVLDAQFSNTRSFSRSISLDLVVTWVPTAEFKFSQTIASVNSYERRIVSAHGIYVTLEISGDMGVFSFPTLIVQMTASLGLLAIAKKIVDFVMLLLPESAEYEEVKFELSEDFSDVRKFKRTGNADLEGAGHVGRPSPRDSRSGSPLAAGGLGRNTLHSSLSRTPGKLEPIPEPPSIDIIGGAAIVDSDSDDTGGGPDDQVPHPSPRGPLGGRSANWSPFTNNNLPGGSPGAEPQRIYVPRPPPRPPAPKGVIMLPPL